MFLVTYNFAFPMSTTWFFMGNFGGKRISDNITLLNKKQNKNIPTSSLPKDLG